MVVCVCVCVSVYVCVCARLLAKCSVSLFTATKYKLAPVNHSSHGCTSSSDVCG